MGSAVSALNSSLSCAMRLKGKDDCNYSRRGGPRKSTPLEPARRWEAARGEWIKIKFMDLRSARTRPPFAGGAEVLIAVWPGLVLCEDGTRWYKRSVGGEGRVFALPTPSLRLSYWQPLVLEELIRAPDWGRHPERVDCLSGGQELEMYFFFYHFILFICCEGRFRKKKKIECLRERDREATADRCSSLDRWHMWHWKPRQA